MAKKSGVLLVALYENKAPQNSRPCWIWTFFGATIFQCNRTKKYRQEDFNLKTSDKIKHFPKKPEVAWFYFYPITPVGFETAIIFSNLIWKSQRIIDKFLTIVEWCSIITIE